MSVATLRYTDDIDGMDDFPLRPGLHWKRRKESETLRTIGRGTMGVFGERGSGKDLFGMSVAYLNKYYFGRRILLDSLPKRAFGEYHLFDAMAMMREINKMAKAAGVEGIETSTDQTEYDEFVGDATEKWVLEGEGYTLFKGAVWYLSELKRYCYKRNPHNKFNKFVGSINSVVRHLDMLIIGTHVHENEIDRFTFLQYCNIRAYCEWCLSREHTTKVRIRRTGYIGADISLGNVEGKPLTLFVDGNEPRDFLGGKRFYDLWKSKNAVNLRPVMAKEM